MSTGESEKVSTATVWDREEWRLSWIERLKARFPDSLVPWVGRALGGKGPGSSQRVEKEESSLGGVCGALHGAGNLNRRPDLATSLTLKILGKR